MGNVNKPPACTLGCLTIDADGKSMHLDRAGGICLRISIAHSVEATIVSAEPAPSSVVVRYGDGTRLTINVTEEREIYERYDVLWECDAEKGNIEDTDEQKTQVFHHYMKDVVSTESGGYWYGGPELAQQRWPLADNSNTFSPYVAGDVLKNFGVNGDPQSGMERYWVCSNKFAIFVPDDVPLWTEHFDGRFSLQAQIRDCIYDSFLDPSVSPVLRYSIFALKKGVQCSLKDFHMAVHSGLYDSLSSLTDEKLIREPIWTTWAKYKEAITQVDLLEFAKDIVNHKAPISQLELDDAWATKYGDFKFDKTKFPNVEEMCENLGKEGIRVTLWVHPFVNLDSENANDPEVRKLLVKDASGNPGITTWWRGNAYIIDFTNPDATRWFADQLRSVQKLGIFSFKFDGGEVTYLPPKFRLHNGSHPGEYVKAYVNMAAQFGTSIEVRVFNGSQNHAIFFRTVDRQSTWDNIGLDTLIPVALNFSIHGYCYNLPDMIGGNGYAGKACDKELYIRWMQLNLFFLTMQFSYTPWEFDSETTEVFLRLMTVRASMLEYIIEAVKESCKRGEPAIRPMWWLSESVDALVCGDQFAVGDRLVVAPVIKKGETSRSVFLPEGKWTCVPTQQPYEGPIRVTVQAPLTGSVPYFKRID